MNETDSNGWQGISPAAQPQPLPDDVPFKFLEEPKDHDGESDDVYWAETIPSAVQYQPKPLPTESPYAHLEESQEADHSIYNLVLRCDQRFHALRTLLRSVAPNIRAFANQHASLRIEHERFDRWIRYIGALADEKMSLDRRLHVHSDLKDLTMQMLALLEYALFHSAWNSMGSAIDISSNLQDINDALGAGAKAIERLHCLAVLIRNSSKSDIVTRVTTAARKLGTKDSVRLETVAALRIKGLYPSIPPSLAEQLVSSISLRRNKILYETKHQEKLSTRRTRPQGSTKDQSQTLQDTTPVTPEYEPSRATGNIPKSVPTTNEQSTTIPSVLNLSELQRRDAQPTEDRDEIATKTSVGRSFPYPRAPHFDDNTLNIDCKWCGKRLERNGVETASRGCWKAHIREDLELYVCISETCSEPFKYFKSFSKWLEHMVLEHTEQWTQNVHRKYVWYCDLGSHEYCEFKSSDLLEKHIIESHFASSQGEELLVLQKERLSEMLEFNTRPSSRDPTICLICGKEPDDHQSQMVTPNQPSVEDIYGDSDVDTHKQITTSTEDPSSGDAQSPGGIPPDNPRSEVPKRVTFSMYESKPDDEEQLGSPRPQYTTATIRLASHIAQHLKSFAFISIRYMDDSDSTSESSSKAGLQDSLDSDKDRRIKQDFLDADEALFYDDITPEQVQSALRTRAPRNYHNHLFWPSSLLEEMLTETVIANLLSISNERAHEIATSYRKVLAILILWEKENEIEQFILSNVRDVDLPLPMDSYETLKQSRACFRRWRTFELDGFQDMQDGMTPLYLDFEEDGRTVRQKYLEPTVVLPFLSEESSVSGGYGTVTKIVIDPRSHNFSNVLTSIVTNDCFALKRISKAVQKKNEIKFDKEVQALQRYSGFIHDHLVTLLMSWKTKNDYFLLFVWAEYDLDDYWAQHVPPVKAGAPDTKAIQWIAKQIVGMAGALNTMHNNPRLTPDQKRYARHGDIKPENILWYRSPSDPKGILVLADLGLTTFNSTKSRSMQSGRHVAVTPVYRPPECDLVGGVVSRASDVWTYGCVLLELVCWALGGQELRNVFEGERSTLFRPTNVRSSIFFDVVIVENGKTEFAVSVKEAVSERIAKLHNHEYCTQFFHDLLDLIENEMITVVSVEIKRIRSHELHDRLHAMYSRINGQPDSYCSTPCPYLRKSKPRVAVEANLHVYASQEIELVRNKLDVFQGFTQASMTPKQLTGLGE